MLKRKFRQQQHWLSKIRNWNWMTHEVVELRLWEEGTVMNVVPTSHFWLSGDYDSHNICVGYSWIMEYDMVHQTCMTWKCIIHHRSSGWWPTIIPMVLNSYQLIVIKFLRILINWTCQLEQSNRLNCFSNMSSVNRLCSRIDRYDVT